MTVFRATLTDCISSHRIYDIFGNMVQVSQPGNYL